MYHAIAVSLKSFPVSSQHYASFNTVPPLVADLFLVAFNEKPKASIKQDIIFRIKTNNPIVIYCGSAIERDYVLQRLKSADVNEIFNIDSIGE